MSGRGLDASRPQPIWPRGMTTHKIERQKTLHELIASEILFLQQLSTVRYLYLYRWISTPDFQMHKQSTAHIFRPCVEIYMVHRKYLLDPMLVLEASDGPQSGYWYILHSWLKESCLKYNYYAGYYSTLAHEIETRLVEDVRFRQFLDQSTRSPQTNWFVHAKSPFDRLQHLESVLSPLYNRSVAHYDMPDYQFHDLGSLIEKTKPLILHFDEWSEAQAVVVVIEYLRANCAAKLSAASLVGSKIKYRSLMGHKTLQEVIVPIQVVIIERFPEGAYLVLHRGSNVFV
ncbi:hypothetical protein F5Y15DRAFT_381310 [Xylariaceae sp. FL0016]|nr:hypothetical protein F5Y15DRAFT_381310 [Xylariaceae sp. FL0016]